MVTWSTTLCLRRIHTCKLGRKWQTGMGQKLMDFTASLEATDAKTITLKLKESYAYVLESIGKPSSLPAFMMPKRLAETPPDKSIPKQIGSGPFNS